MDDAAAGKAWRWFLPALLGSTALPKLFSRGGFRRS
jgi:hypothetical protein